MNELGLVGFREPVARLFNQGMIHYHGAKMSKSKGNVVEPLHYADRYGADTVRMYALFMGPADEDMEWQDTGIEGVWRFLNRLWRVAHEQAGRAAAPAGVDTPLARKAHRTIAKVTDDIDRRFLFHTPIAAVMELVNEIQAAPDDPAARFATETAVSLIQPYAPHVAEELWGVLGSERLWQHPWPEADPALARAGDRRGRRAGERQAARPPPGARDTADDELAAARARLRARPGAPERRRARKTIVVPGQARQPRRLDDAGAALGRSWPRPGRHTVGTKS